jgi:hypothetical protein
VRVYLDICALKRPFDDQTQPRIRLETDAVLELLAAPEDRLTFLHSAAHDLENSQNPVPWRLARVADWPAALPRSDAKAADRLLGLGKRHATLLGVRVLDVVTLAREVFS